MVAIAAAQLFIRMAAQSGEIFDFHFAASDDELDQLSNRCGQMAADCCIAFTWTDAAIAMGQARFMVAGRKAIARTAKAATLAKVSKPVAAAELVWS